MLQDKTISNFSSPKIYKHWGTLDLGASGNVSEPNGNGKGSPIELCALANYTEAFGCEGDMTGELGTAFGWADTVCSRRYVSICRIMREWPAGLQGLLAGPCRETNDLPACLAEATSHRTRTAGIARARGCACLGPRVTFSQACQVAVTVCVTALSSIAAGRRMRLHRPASYPRSIGVDTHSVGISTRASPLPAAYQVFPYTSKSFNNTYKFNNEPMLQQHAQETCKCQGGHLVSYISPGEQNEVERYMVDQVGVMAVLLLLSTCPPAAAITTCWSHLHSLRFLRPYKLDPSAPVQCTTTPKKA